MPVIITKADAGGTEYDYYLVPAPLVSFNKQIYNNIGRPAFGSDFSVSLQGTLVPMLGNPYYSGDASPVEWLKDTNDTSGIFRNRGVDNGTIENHPLTEPNLLDTTIRKQEKLRWLFSNPIVSGVARPIKVSIRGWDDADYGGSGLVFNAFVDDVAFDPDGRGVNPAGYSINLRMSNFLTSANTDEFSDYKNENDPTYQISSLTENFDIQEDGQKTLKFGTDVTYGHKFFESANKVYAINRSITAVGSPVYDENGAYVSGLSPWQQASGFVYEYLGLGSGSLPNFRSDLKNHLGTNYSVGNVVYQESVDQEGGTYSLTETYLAYSGDYPVIETITINQDIGENEANAISVQGNIQGLNTNGGFNISDNSYSNASGYWQTISTGIPADAYYHALGALPSSSWLHPKALSRSVGRDFAAGNISYSYNFDDRPPNLVPGSVSESIQISDTYPGEIFSVTPVIGRSQPVLQYLNSRSEYKRSLSINVTMGAQTPSWMNSQVNGSGTLADGGGGGATRNQVLQSLLINQKPSITNSGELGLIYEAANPVNDPNFSVTPGKCFHSAPNENWDARTRSYSYNVEWTYERSS